MADTDVLPHSDAAQKNWDAFHRAWHNGHFEYITKAERFNNFYLGEQWGEADRQRLEELKRPALTLNEILQVINAITGHYGETRADIKYKPRKGAADAETAHVLTRLCDYVLDSTNYITYHEPRMFEDGVIEDRGYVDVRMDFTDNLLGEVCIKNRDPRTVIPDPDSDSANPSDWKRVMTITWMPLDDIEAHYGKAARRSVESIATTPSDTFGENSIKYQSFGQNGAGHDATIDPNVKAVRVIDHQYRKMTRVKELVDLETGHTRTIPDDWVEGRAEAVAAYYGLGIRTRVKSRIRWTVSADRVTLYDKWSPYSNFTIVPYYPIYRRGRPSGIVRHLCDPQEQLNKIESQILHTINTTANSGWTTEQGSLVNMTEAELETRGAETGLVLVYGRNRAPPEKIKPNTVPTGLESFAQKAGEYIHNIPGASSLLGHNPGTNVSGVALDFAQGKALLGLQVVFNNLNFTRKLVAERILDCVQTFYTEHRVFRVTNWRDPEQPEETLEINAQAANEVVHNIGVGQYDVVATGTPTRDTFEDMQFAQIIELRNAGVMIPDHHVILSSQLAGKEKIAAEVKQLQGLGELDERQQALMQLEMEQAQATVAETQGRVAELEGRAALHQAKAQGEIAGEQREQVDMLSKYRMELARLKAELAKQQRDLETKREIAEIHSRAKEALTRYQTRMRGNEDEKERQVRLTQERMRSRTAIGKEGLRDRTELMREGMRARQRGGQSGSADAGMGS